MTCERIISISDFFCYYSADIVQKSICTVSQGAVNQHPRAPIGFGFMGFTEAHNEHNNHLSALHCVVFSFRHNSSANGI